ncbi:acyl-[ACP]--phospholipid O-acyltransferase [Nitratifractor salsuginis]|uniref:AMP-dependent synthetase and ligase n=1 Tax=Nitratifractor salsuginis (strain DSM 16511 / JCM 12458 / E9I37-1) TaxID=749222 RepID=E6X2A6_NITSE|nr:acyl-[ACP]--phospholipid O-acyltransferase [Nitratifractor salsuginis]ADV46041.1 AMP-dependent synthetase and ligase [Nitratifractor salsuginis DSM 16511]
MKTLLSLRGFAPFLLVLVFNAMTDIAHKITIQNVLIKSYSGDTLLILSALVNALILLPFILFFSPSGWLSDRFDKSRIVRGMALAGFFLAVAATLSYYQGWFVAAFGMTLLLAVQSALYSPAKYALIRHLAGTERLAAANALVQALTIAAILVSGLLFSWVFEGLYDGSRASGNVLRSVAPLGWGLILMSGMEYLFARRIPSTGEANRELFELGRYLRLEYLRRNLSTLKSDRNIWLSIVGLAVFWGLSQLIIAAFPTHYKLLTGDDNTVMIQGLLALSAVGIVLGSLVAGRFSRLHIELGLVPLGAFGLFASLTLLAASATPFWMGVATLAFGFFGGLAIVPLNATVQFLAPLEKLGVILAGSNFVQNLAMLAALLGTILMVWTGFSTLGILHTSAWLTLAAAVYALLQLPQLGARLLLLPLLRTRYRLSVEGLEHLPPKGGVLLLGNHISWIDWLILQVASPRTIKFVMEKRIYEQWYLRWFLRWFDMIPISGSASKGAIEAIRRRLDAGEVVALFPEGRISYNGQLNEFKRGFEKVMEACDVPIVPFYLHGLWGSTFSRANPRYRLVSRHGARRELGVWFGAPLPSDARADRVKQAVRSLSFRAWDQTIDRQEPLHLQWLRRCKEHPFERAVADASGTDLNRVQLLTAVLLFIKALKPALKDQKNVGVLLPSSAAGSIVNLALMALGKRPVNLNYTLSAEAMEAAVDRAGLQTVISSEQFLKKLSAKGFDPAALLGERLLMAETVGKGFDTRSKALAMARALLLPASWIRALYFEPVTLEETATILFSSGSEGTPKGIELSHRNLLGNIKQVSAMLNFSDDDLILGSLPIFHSFGLTVTTLLPLCEGIPVAAVPDPTDALSVGKMAARYGATILFGTSTFFRLYARNRKLHPLMFASIRMGVAGAEKLKPEIKEAFRAKFGVELYEGYGTTETSPVISVNMPDRLDPDTFRVIQGNRPGTVGQPLPGTLIRISDPESLEELPTGEDGLIMVAGVQVMKGYLRDPEKTAEVIAEIDGVRYYKTGDKGHLDEDGFITIVDRYSRFAKIGGEMISLGAVEEKLAALLGEGIELAAVALPDEKKGERIVLLYSGEIAPEELIERIKTSDLPPIMRPDSVYQVETLPKLASGKADFKGARRLAEQLQS